MKYQKVTRKQKVARMIAKVSLVTALLGAGGMVMVNKFMPDEPTDSIQVGINEYEEVESTLENTKGENEIEPKYDFEELKKDYPDIIGVIEGPCLSQAYPVVHDKLSGGYYLNHLPSGEESGLGSVCFNEENQVNLQDDFSIIYAHNIEGAMFGDLEDYYSDPKNVETPLYFYTPYGEYELIPFASFHTNEAVYGNFDEKDKMEIIETFKNKSDINTNVEITSDDNLISLFTCLDYSDPEYGITDMRYFLILKIKTLTLYNAPDYTSQNTLK